MKRNLVCQHIGCVCKAWIGFVLLCATSSTWATTCMEYLNLKPYLGWEYQYEHIKPSYNYRNILSADSQTGNFFIGTRFLRYLGMEVGYYRSLKTAQQQDQLLSFNGESINGGGFYEGTLTRTSFKGFSFDLAAYWAIDAAFNASIIAGLATMHPTMTFESFNGTDFGTAFELIKPKNATVPRVGMGLELLYKHWGLRSRIFWVYTQSMKLNISAAKEKFPALINNPYVQAVEATVGFFYIF